MNFRPARFPPIGPLLAVKKTNASKEPRVAKDERLLRLSEDQVIMFFDDESRRRDPQFSAHSEMNPEPVVAREFEEHLLPARLRTERFLPNEPMFERPHVCSAEDAFFAVQFHTDDRFFKAGIPASPKIFDLRQLRHPKRLLDEKGTRDGSAIFSGEHGQPVGRCRLHRRKLIEKA